MHLPLQETWVQSLGREDPLDKVHTKVSFTQQLFDEWVSESVNKWVNNARYNEEIDGFLMAPAARDVLKFLRTISFVNHQAA